MVDRIIKWLDNEGNPQSMREPHDRYNPDSLNFWGNQPGEIWPLLYDAVPRNEPRMNPRRERQSVETGRLVGIIMSLNTPSGPLGPGDVVDVYSEMVMYLTDTLGFDIMECDEDMLRDSVIDFLRSRNIVG